MFNKLYQVIKPLLVSIVFLSTIVDAAVVGTIPAQFTVSGGQTSYSVPIQVAPGRGGVKLHSKVTQCLQVKLTHP